MWRELQVAIFKELTSRGVPRALSIANDVAEGLRDKTMMRAHEEVMIAFAKRDLRVESHALEDVARIAVSAIFEGHA